MSLHIASALDKPPRYKMTHRIHRQTAAAIPGYLIQFYEYQSETASQCRKGIQEFSLTVSESGIWIRSAL